MKLSVKLKEKKTKRKSSDGRKEIESEQASELVRDDIAATSVVEQRGGAMNKKQTLLAVNACIFRQTKKGKKTDDDFDDDDDDLCTMLEILFNECVSFSMFHI